MKINKYNMDKILWKMALAMGILCVMNGCSRTVFTSDGYIGPVSYTHLTLPTN